MFQDVATTESNYQRFLKRVSEFGAVWGLKHPEGGWAVCPSNEYEDIRKKVPPIVNVLCSGQTLLATAPQMS